MKVVILAGGLGTRMGKTCENTPKPMIESDGKPVLLHQIEFFKREGINEFIIVTGYKSEAIEGFFGNGEKFSVNISYYKETEPLGTAGALFRLELEGDFILCNGDLIFDFDLNSFLAFHKKNNSLATLIVHPNSHPYDSLSLKTDKDGKVTDIYTKSNKPEFYPNLCNAGIEILSPELLLSFNISGKADLDRDIIAKSVESGRIFAYRTSEYIHDMGTPERLIQVEKDIKNGVVKSRNRLNPQKAVFVDRDGTLNKMNGYITNPYDLELIDGVSEAVRTFNNLGYLTIVVTNQPVIARGECTVETLENIHSRLEMLLSEKGAFLDGIYFCPHHPHKGFEGEISELKTECNCRKPSPGLILSAQKDFNIDLSASFMVGDSLTDAMAGKNAGCTPVLIGDEHLSDTLHFKSLYEFAQHLKEMNQ